MKQPISFEEFFKNYDSQAKNYITEVSDNLLYIIIQAYSTYLLEAFAGEVKTKYELQFCNDGNGCGIPYCDQPCQEIKPQSIDQLLTKFKEKL